jgi:hypothetical protein
VGINADTFVMIAASIDEQGRKGADSEPVNDDTWNNAVLAATFLAKNADALHNDVMYSSLKKLAFVPATQVCPEFPSQDHEAL